MFTKVVVTTAVAAAVVGGGGAALAATASHAASSAPAPTSASPTSTSPTSTSTATPTATAGHAKHRRRDALRRAVHATWVTKRGTTGDAFVTHDAIRGTVSAVSATSITVKAIDGVTQTFQVTSATKVRKRAAVVGTPPKTTTKHAGRANSAHAAHQATASTIGAVKTGDKAVVVGTATTTLIARRIVDRATKKVSGRADLGSGSRRRPCPNRTEPAIVGS